MKTDTATDSKATNASSLRRTLLVLFKPNVSAPFRPLRITHETHEADGSGGGTLPTLQALVGGYIEKVTLRVGVGATTATDGTPKTGFGAHGYSLEVDLWINGEGLLLDLPFCYVAFDKENDWATLLAGPVVAALVGTEGETLGFGSDSEAEAFADALNKGLRS